MAKMATLGLIKIISENFQRVLSLGIHSGKHEFNSNQQSKKEKLKSYKVSANEKNKREDIIMQSINSRGLLTHTWNIERNPGTLTQNGSVIQDRMWQHGKKFREGWQR